MSEWKEYRLSDLMEIKGGGTPKTSKPEYWNGNIPWISVTDFNNGSKYIYKTERTITEEGFKKSSTRMLKKGEILISARGTVGAIAILSKDMAFNQTCYGLNAKDNLTTNDFLYYLLKANIDKLLNFSYGAVFDTITRETFNHIFVSIPTFPEQKTIASVLSFLDDKIELLRKQNETLERLALLYFKNIFNTNGQKSVLSDEFEIIMGQSPQGKSYNEEKIGPIFFQGRTDFGFRFPIERVYCTEPKRMANKFDTLVSVRAPVGDINMAITDCCIGRGLAAFRYRKDKSFNSYTYYKIKSISEEIKAFDDVGTVFGAISKTDFDNFGIKLFNYSLIENFQKIAEPIDRKIFCNTIQINQLSKLRDSLLPRLMSGEVRVIIKNFVNRSFEIYTKPIFTIGHSNHSAESFIKLLQKYNINVVADVRSIPYSKYNPQFNKETLKELLKKVKIKYLFMGNELGGRPLDDSYFNEGVADYNKMSSNKEFKFGIQRLLNGRENYTIAILCSEKDPLNCHRMLLVGKVLSEKEAQVKHILYNGELEDNKQTEERLLKVTGIERSLFSSELEEKHILEQAYKIQSKEAAYKKTK